MSPKIEFTIIGVFAGLAFLAGFGYGVVFASLVSSDHLWRMIP